MGHEMAVSDRDWNSVAPTPTHAVRAARTRVSHSYWPLCFESINQSGFAALAVLTFWRDGITVDIVRADYRHFLSFGERQDFRIPGESGEAAHGGKKYAAKVALHC